MAIFRAIKAVSIRPCPQVDKVSTLALNVLTPNPVNNTLSAAFKDGNFNLIYTKGDCDFNHNCS